MAQISRGEASAANMCASYERVEVSFTRVEFVAYVVGDQGSGWRKSLKGKAGGSLAWSASHR